MEYEFLKYLKNEWDIETISCIGCGFTKFDLPQKSKGIMFNNGLVLSIQGSYRHYCFPRKTLPYDQYKKMEFALCTENGFANVNDYLDTNEFDTYFDGSVYGYVPVELIEKLYQSLKQKFGVKE